MSDIQVILNEQQRLVLALFKSLRFAGSMTKPNRLGRVHPLSEAARDLMAVELAAAWHEQYILLEVAEDSGVRRRIRKVRNTEDIDPNNQRRFPDALAIRLTQNVDGPPVIATVLDDSFSKETELSTEADIIKDLLDTRTFNGKNPVLREIAGTINHFILNSPRKVALKTAYKTVLDACSPLFSFIQEHYPIELMLGGEALLLENLTLETEFQTYFFNRFVALEGQYFKVLTKVALQKNGVRLEESDGDLSSLFNNVAQDGVSLTNPAPDILKLFNEFNESGGGELNKLISEYLDKIGAHPKNRMKIEEEMANFLNTLSLDPAKLNEEEMGGKPILDEFFGAAYIHARRVVSGDQDPVKSVFASRKIDEWDFTVETFDHLEEQGITPSNIKAAGALYYIYELGDRLGIFRLTDMLVLMWAQGRLDLNQKSQAVTEKLYNYYKIRDTRISPEERAMVYRMVLNKGNGNLLSRMIPNEDFTLLWQQLMSEVVEYIQKSERHQTEDNLVSKHGIFQATRNLQYNLTTHMVGKPLMDAHEMYFQLQECFEILQSDDIIKRLAGGSHSNMWGVIENLSREEFSVAPNISAARTVAVEGNKIFQWIADFKSPKVASRLVGQIPESLDFQNFLHSAEAYILAQGQLEGDSRRMPGRLGAGSNGNGAMFHDEFEEEDDGLDFDDVEEVSADEFDF